MNFKRNRKKAKKMNETIVRPCTPAESLEQSLSEMMLIRQGKMKKHTWKEFLKELEEENE